MSDVIERSDNWVEEELQQLLADHALTPDPFPLYARLRAESPIRTCNGITLVTRYDLVNALYRSPLLSRHEAAILESRTYGETDTGDPEIEEIHLAQVSMLINQDDPAHNRIRRILDKTFRPKAVAEWLPRVQAITDELIDGVSHKPEFDLMSELAYPLPEAIICDLMGVPREDHTLWNRWIATTVGTNRTGTPTEEHRAEVTKAHKDFLDYFRDLVARRRHDLGTDLVSELIRAEDEGDRLSELELLGTLQMLIAAGQETTANLIGNGMYALLSHPDQYRTLRSDPSLVPDAIEEFLRYDSPSHWSLPRIAVEAIHLDGGSIERGAVVILAITAANHDPEVFDQPDELNIERKNNRHIGFAAGPHFCLGAMLARQESRVMFEAIMARLPRLELVAPPARKTTFVRALDRLLVRKAA